MTKLNHEALELAEECFGVDLVRHARDHADALGVVDLIVVVEAEVVGLAKGLVQTRFGN